MAAVAAAGEAAEHLGVRHGPLQMPEQDIKST